MKKFSVVIAKRHSTSISLEEEFYNVLISIAKEKNVPLNALITEIDEKRTKENLSSALRVFILDTLLEKINTD